MIYRCTVGVALALERNRSPVNEKISHTSLQIQRYSICLICYVFLFHITTLKVTKTLAFSSAASKQLADFSEEPSRANSESEHL